MHTPDGAWHFTFLRGGRCPRQWFSEGQMPGVGEGNIPHSAPLAASAAAARLTGARQGRRRRHRIPDEVITSFLVVGLVVATRQWRGVTGVRSERSRTTTTTTDPANGVVVVVVVDSRFTRPTFIRRPNLHLCFVQQEIVHTCSTVKIRLKFVINDSHIECFPLFVLPF